MRVVDITEDADDGVRWRRVICCVDLYWEQPRELLTNLRGREIISKRIKRINYDIEERRRARISEGAKQATRTHSFKTIISSVIS